MRNNEKVSKEKGNTNIKQIVFPFGRAETEGFEPSYRDEPINAFRVRRVTAASLRLQDVCLFKKGRLHIIIHIFSDLYREITK